MIDGAADEGILRFDLVYQTSFEQEIQRPVDRRRRRTMPFATDGRQQIISLGRAMVCPQQFEYTPPNGRQAQPTLGTGQLGLFQGIADTDPMVVLIGKKRITLYHGYRNEQWERWP